MPSVSKHCARLVIRQAWLAGSRIQSGRRAVARGKVQWRRACLIHARSIGHVQGILAPPALLGPRNLDLYPLLHAYGLGLLYATPRDVCSPDEMLEAGVCVSAGTLSLTPLLRYDGYIEYALRTAPEVDGT